MSISNDIGKSALLPLPKSLFSSTLLFAHPLNASSIRPIIMNFQFLFFLPSGCT